MRFIQYSLLSFVLLTSITFASAKADNQPDKKPNIVFIMVDDMGWSDASCYGRTEWQTPSIDRLASEGTRFLNAYAQPLCSPTRSELMTGKHAARLRITDWLPGFPNPEESPLLPVTPNAGVPLEDITIAEAFKEQGYTTGIVGKWHIGNHPSQQGFDYVREFHNGHRPRFVNGRFMTDIKGDYALEFLDENKNNPFFLYLSFDAVHLPIDATKEKIEKYKKLVNSKYAAMMEHVDDNIGRVLTKLDELNLNSNTIVIFYSDNGGVTRCNFNPEIFTSNFPLRGNKGSVYEGGIRVPLIFRYPGKIKANSSTDALVAVADFYPTLLDMAGIEKKEKQHIDGMSFEGVFRGEPSKRETLFWHYPHYSRHLMGFPSTAIRDGEWKLIQWFGDGKIELYNLKEDIGERNNLNDHFPEKVSEMLAKLNQWQKEVGADMPEFKN